MVTPAPRTPDTSARFFGLILVSIGILWLALTGLCTVVALALLASEGDLGDIMLILPFTAVSTILGGAVYLVGRLMRPRS
jgi:hypothetical protein